MSLTEEAKKAKRDYFRRWRKKNPDKVRKYQDDYWNRKAQKSEK